MKKILLLSNPDSIWTQKYIENVLLNQDYSIYLVEDKSSKYHNFYVSNSINIIKQNISGIIFKLPMIRSIVYRARFLKKIKKMGPFDCTHIHLCTKDKIKLVIKYKKIFGKTIVSFWGSDLFRASESTIAFYKKKINQIDYVTVCTKSMFDSFYSKFGSVFLKKPRIIDFGVNAISTINSLHDSDSFRLKYGIDSSKKIVTIGYNGSKSQQHIQVIKSLKERLQQQRK